MDKKSYMKLVVGAVLAVGLGYVLGPILADNVTVGVAVGIAVFSGFAAEAYGNSSKKKSEEDKSEKQ